jgi:hypothetical protein
MFNRLLIAVLTIGLLLTFSSAAISSNDAPKHGLQVIEKINPNAPRYSNLQVAERSTPPFQKPSPELFAVETPTTILPPQYFCEFIDYSGGAAAYYFKIPDVYGDDELGMRFTPYEGYTCTLLTAYIGYYGTYWGAHHAGGTDMYVTVYADNGFGLPGTQLGQVFVDGSTLPTSGMAYVPVDMTPLGPLVFTDGEEFHIGVSPANWVDGDTLAILSDDGSAGQQRAWDHWYAGYFLMVDDWGGFDNNFLIGVDICCGKIPYTSCYTQAYNCGIAYYWEQPDAYGDDYFNMRFSVDGPETLMEIGIALYEPPTVGTPDLDVFVWGDDGFGFPDLGNVIYSTTIPYASLQFFPNYNVIDLSSLNIVMRDEFHVGWSTNDVTGGTLAGLSDDGSCGTLRSSEWWSGAFSTILNDWGADVNFLIYAHMCRDEFSQCKTLSYYCNLYYVWWLPDRYGDIGDYELFSPFGIGCRLEKFRVALYWPGSQAGWPRYTYNSEVQVWPVDPGTGLPDNSGAPLAAVTLTPADYVIFPGWTEVDFTTALPDPLLFDGNIWIGIESFAPDTLHGIVTISDDASCGQQRSAESWYGSMEYMLSGWGIDPNFVMEADVCCIPLPGVTCQPGEDWPTGGKDFARTGRSLSSLGDAQGKLCRAWQYNNSQVMAYGTPVIWKDTIVGYFLNNLVAVDVNTGTQIWQRLSDGFEVGGGVYTSPTVYNFADYGQDTTLVFFPGGDSKSFTAVRLKDGTTKWTRNFLAHNMHFMTFGASVIADMGGVPVIYYNDDDGYIYAVNALTGALYSGPGWVVNPIYLNGAVWNGVTTDGEFLYIGTIDNITEGNIYCVDAATGATVWDLQTTAGLQLPILDPANDAIGSTEAFAGRISYDVYSGEPTLFAASVYSPDSTPPYRSGGIIYSINATDGSLNWANLCIENDYEGLNIDGDQVIQIGWAPWVPGYGDYRGPIAFNKSNGSKNWYNTTTNPGLGDFWMMDAVMSCENYDEPGLPDWIVAQSRNNFVDFYHSVTGAHMFHRRFVGVGANRAGHRVGTIMDDGHLIVTWRNKMIGLAASAKDLRPRLDIPKYTIEIPSENDPPNTDKHFPNAIGNMGGAPLTIDSVRLSDTDNSTSPPPSASLSMVNLEAATAMDQVANKFASNVEAFRATLSETLDDIVNPSGVTKTRGNAAFALPSFVNGLVGPVDGTVIPPQATYNDSSAYIDIVVNIDGNEVPRGYHSFYARVYSDDPDYFLDSARMVYPTAYCVPQILLAIVGGCQYSQNEVDFGVGVNNYFTVWNATKIADGDITSNEIDGDHTSFWQGAYIFGKARTGTGTIPGKIPGIMGANQSLRVAQYAENWSAADPANWQSILPDPSCYDGACPGNLITNVLLGEISNDSGASYDQVYGEVFCYAFVDSVQNFCEYDTLGNCIHWLWDYAKPSEYGVQAPYSDTLTMGFHACAAIIGAYDEPLLNNFVIHRFDFSGRYGAVNGVYMGAMLDYDILTNDKNVAGYDATRSTAWAYDCSNKTRGWGMVKIPWGVGYTPMKNAKSVAAAQGGWNDSSVWLDSAYYWMSALNGLSHQTGIDPVVCPSDPDDREVFFTLGSLDMPAAPSTVTMGVALFGRVGVTDASNPATYDTLAHVANGWCGFGRGDVNFDGKMNIVDIAYLIDYVYYGGNGPYPFEHLGDVNCDGAVNGLDITYMIQYYFFGGPAPCGKWTLGGCE